jgi:hypothetical protein
MRRCERIMVGSGTDTYDAICELRAGHTGPCKSTAARDQHHIERALTLEVERAARTISPALWGGPYRDGEGVMHYATGPYWRNELLDKADDWERLARAARVCAEALPDA